MTNTNDNISRNSEQDAEPILFESRVFNIVERKQLGRSGKILTRHIVKHPGAVAIVPILNDGNVLLIRQFRVSFQREIYEIPAGTREPNEPPEQTAIRELIEETGYRADNIEKLHTIYTSPGVLQEELIIYLATGLKLGQSAPEDGEKIVNEILSWRQINQMIENNQIADAKSIVGLLLAQKKLFEK